MARLRAADRFVVTGNLDGFAVTKSIIATLLACCLLITPAWGTPSSSLGTIVYADRAHVGAAAASAGATVFGGDRLSTEQTGSVQVRAGSARLLLSGSSSVTLSNDVASPAATLTIGSATFSTANSKAFALRVASVVIRPSTDQPTIGHVTVLGPKELVVKSVRGSLTIAVEDDVREIPEGAAYRIVLEPSATPEPQGPQGAGTKGPGNPPIKAAKGGKFMWYVIGATAIITVWAVHEVFESPDRP